MPDVITNKYTVVGYWNDNNQPFVAHAEAANVADAICIARESVGDTNHEGTTIVEVLIVSGDYALGQTAADECIVGPTGWRALSCDIRRKALESRDDNLGAAFALLCNFVASLQSHAADDMDVLGMFAAFASASKPSDGVSTGFGGDVDARVDVSGGVADVAVLSPGTRVEVRDFDVDGMTGDHIKKTDAGQQYAGYVAVFNRELDTSGDKNRTACA